MIKPFKFNEMSDKKCPNCGRPFKKNVTARKKKLERCYQCDYLRLSVGKNGNPEKIKKYRKHCVKGI